MITRTHLILLAVLLALIATDLALTPGRVRREESGLLFADLEVSAAQRVQIEEAGKRLVLERAGDGWQVDQPPGFPAEGRAMTDWIGALTRLVEVDRVGRTDTASEAFGFADAAESDVRVSVFGSEGRLLAAYRQGSVPVAARAGSGRLGVYLAPEGSSDIYRAAGVPPVHPEGQRFWDPRLFKVGADRVRLLELESQGNAARVQRDTGGVYRFVAEERPQEAPGLLVAEVLAVAQSLVLEDVRAYGAGDADGFVEPFARWRVESEDEQPFELVVGALVGDDRRLVRLSAWDGRFVGEIRTAILDEAFAPGSAIQRLFARALEAER